MKVLKQQLRKLTKEQYKIIKDFCHYSNNLYNCANYIVREYYKETNKYLGFKQLWREIKSNENYKLLPAQSATQIVKLADKNYRAYFALLKRKLSGGYNGEINIPKFRKKGDMYILIYTYQTLTMPKIPKRPYISLNLSDEYKKRHNKDIKLRIPFTYNIDGKVKQIIIKPFNKGQYFNLYICYDENKKEANHGLDKSKVCAIDFGINNLVTAVDTSGHSLIMNGKPLKSYNRWFNISRSALQSELKLKNNRFWSKRLESQSQKRFWYIDNYFNQITNKIIKHCLHNKIGTLVVGYNEGWKQDINIGKINNQKFVYIPYYILKRKLESKCQEYGVDFILKEESYTSKCSFLDNEEIEKHDSYLGKRIHRGLFKSSNGTLINADVNGAANILRKVFPNAFANGILDVRLHPIIINIFDNYKQNE